MPLYEYRCQRCGFIREELKKMEDDQSPKCPYCKNEIMKKLFSTLSFISKERSQEKLRKRSIDQGKKFFKRYPKYQEISTQSVENKPKN